MDADSKPPLLAYISRGGGGVHGEDTFGQMFPPRPQRFRRQKIDEQTNKHTYGHRHRAEPSLLRQGFNKIQIELNELLCSVQHSDNVVTLSYSSEY